MPTNEESVRSQIAARLAGKQAIAPMLVHETPTLGLTNGELRAICAKNPDHPMSQLKLASMQGFPDERTMFHETADVEAILDNKLVEVFDTIEEKKETGERIRVRRKRLIDFPSGKAPKLVDPSTKKASAGTPRPEPATP